MDDISPSSSKITNERELVTILVEIRDALNDESKSLVELQLRLQALSTPNEIMHVIAPLLVSADNSSQDSPTAMEIISCADALNILAWLISPSANTTNNSKSSEYLEAASKAIRLELQKLRNSSNHEGELNAMARELRIPTKLVSVLVHQACTGWNVKVAQDCHESLLLLCKLLPPTHALISFVWKEIVEIWSSAFQSIDDKKSRVDSSTICIRCATLAVDIAVLSDISMQSAIDASAMDLLLKLFQATMADLLLQISILELFQTLASTRPHHLHRARWLLSDTVTQPLLRIVGVGSDVENSEVDPYLQGPALRVLASLCSCLMTAMKSEVGRTGGGMRDGLVHDMLAALRRFGTTGGELDCLLFIDAVSSLASTSAVAMNLVLDDSTVRDTWLNLSVAQPKMKSAILVSVAQAIDPDPEGSSVFPDSLTNELCMKLYAALGIVNNGTNHHNSTDLLLKLVASPIPEIRFGVYRLFRAVAKNSLGGQILMAHSKFYDFLIPSDRIIEPTFEGRILKYAIVEAVYNNSTLRQLLSNEIVQQLTQCIAQGPHYKKVLQWDVVTAER
jgi:hypothetical protein